MNVDFEKLMIDLTSFFISGLAMVGLCTSISVALTYPSAWNYFILFFIVMVHWIIIYSTIKERLRK